MNTYRAFNKHRNRIFLKTISTTSRNLILDNIANHYNVSREDAYEEVVGDEAEHLLEYITGVERNATLILMKRYGLA
jgi:hypothetical protein